MKKNSVIGKGLITLNPLEASEKLWINKRSLSCELISRRA